MRKHERGVTSAPRKQECRLIVGCTLYCNKTTRRGAPPSLCVFAMFLPEHGS